MTSLLLFGPGYAGSRIAAAVAEQGGRVVTVRSRADGQSLGIDDRDALAEALAHASHVVSTVPPVGEVDPVLARYRDRLAGRWVGYLSSTGVYGDAGGAWVDESAPTDRGRRSARNAADADWLALGAHVFRLPGIYGPGRSALDRVAAGQAHRIDLPDQIFSRIHVDDIVSGVIAALAGPAGAYNLADDLPASQNDVVEAACALLGVAPPPILSIEAAGLSPQARSFYAENRRVANGKAKRLLGWKPAYPDYRAGLRALSAMTSPAIVSTAATPA
ncbi:SDR family NAD(P)-dependent oxidoreductase [Sphingomonas sp. 1P06PA]|uniref:SDR family NAD(P)-dependent oxidoreductase n=1 Tax=Sphingomonas sp. 1P06PA TaxID=554121 RepID=UPI0039A50C52